MVRRCTEQGGHAINSTPFLIIKATILSDISRNAVVRCIPVSTSTASQSVPFFYQVSLRELCLPLRELKVVLSRSLATMQRFPMSFLASFNSGIMK